MKHNLKKCPPGVICVENLSFVFISICLFILGYLLYSNLKSNNVTVNNHSSEKIVLKEPSRENTYGLGLGLGLNWLPSWPYSNDVLLNPYSPPLSDERYMVPRVSAMPINVSTNVGAVETSYRQVGILNASNTDGKVLPLMGRPVFTNRNKWQYYTISDQHNSVKLPVSRGGKSCTNEYGCDQLYNGDTIYVEGLNQPYIVTIYDNDTIKYIPVI